MLRPKLTPLYTAVSLLFSASAFSDDQAPKWDVNAPLNAPLEQAQIQVSEGTWMNLSLSPDGKYLVFDLLGDIYRIPAQGGEAKPLAQGIAWQMQPVYSPDGKYIAFTSDQDGGDNIWVMNADGSNPRPVTNETFRLLNSPAWSPDSQYLVARKHFTASRSLGAGEVWLYHIAGGEGVKLTERPNDQKDLGEPAYSPDGRYIYFSQDATPGKTFHYSKDSVKGIYKIKRYDTQTGDIEVLIEGTGGAIRPTPSRMVSSWPTSNTTVFSQPYTCWTWLPVKSKSSMATLTETCRKPGRYTVFIPLWPGVQIVLRSISGQKAKSTNSNWLPSKRQRSHSMSSQSLLCNRRCALSRI